jgi:hypothetical protein
MHRYRLHFRIWAAVTVFLLIGDSDGIAEDQQEKPKFDSRLQELYQNEAGRWEMWVDAQKQHKAELVAEPVFRWQNLSRSNGQTGALYVWTYQGRPAVIGGIFSNPENNRRVIIHEFHALSPDRLFPVFRDSKSMWLPGAGVTMSPLLDSPVVPETAPKRLLQIRSIARDFSAHSVDNEKHRWELRLLPRPLYRYDKPQGEIIDGAILAFVSDAGTDPEIVLALEARKTTEGAQWFFRTVRLSISDLHVEYKDQPVWTSLRDDPEGQFGNKDNTYGLVRDRLIDDDGR